MDFHNRSVFLILIIGYLLIPSKASSMSFDNISFKLTSFDPNYHKINYEGDASVAGQVIQLTKNQQDTTLNASTGRATYAQPLHLWDKASNTLADFTTNFSFSVYWEDYDLRGDGLTFFLAPNGSKLPPDSSGGHLSLLSATQGSNSPTGFVAVEFDSYSSSYSNGWDPEYTHVGIDLNSLRSNETARWHLDSVNGKTLNASISYVSAMKNLSVLLVVAEDMVNSSSLHLVVDLRDYLPEWVTFGFSGATGECFEIHKIISWEFSSSLEVNATVTPPPQASPSSRGENKMLRIALGSGGGMLIFNCLLLGLVWFFCWMKLNRREDGEKAADEDVEMITGPRKFSYRELVAATNNFADEGLLGEGGFGKVYEGFLMDGKINVAVKKITPQAQQGMKQYTSEVKTISRLRHRNLVQLFGWCREKEELLIVYEFVPNKSLDYHLFQSTNLLTWENRYRIALGLASALFYLQEDCEQCVLHRDIKSSNVLVDLNFNAKLGDFGLARLVDHGQRSQTTILFGTEGYVAPEYQHSSKASKESDIYSFGIVALEIACGKQAIKEVQRDGQIVKLKLVEFAWEHHGRSNIFKAADPKLCNDYDEEEMERLLVIGLACAHPIADKRPSIRQVVDMLNFKAPLPQLPPEMPVPTHVSTYQEHLQLRTISESHSSQSSSGSARVRSQNLSAQSNASSSKITTRSSTPSDTGHQPVE